VINSISLGRKTFQFVFHPSEKRNFLVGRAEFLLIVCIIKIKKYYLVEKQDYPFFFEVLCSRLTRPQTYFMWKKTGGKDKKEHELKRKFVLNRVNVEGKSYSSFVVKISF
jgi:hypothetical protein